MKERPSDARVGLTQPSGFSYHAPFPVWAIVFVLLTLSPSPLAVPNGIVFTLIGLVGMVLLFAQPGQSMESPASGVSNNRSRDLVIERLGITPV